MGCVILELQLYGNTQYFTFEQSAALLQAVSGQNEKRDYAILMLFLNCGIRRSELVGLNLSDIYEDRIRVVGKGNKERFVYFGSACRKDVAASYVETGKYACIFRIFRKGIGGITGLISHTNSVPAISVCIKYTAYVIAYIPDLDIGVHCSA